MSKQTTTYVTWGEQGGVEVAVNHDLDKDDTFRLSVQVNDETVFLDKDAVRELKRDLSAAEKEAFSE